MFFAAPERPAGCSLDETAAGTVAISSRWLLVARCIVRFFAPCGGGTERVPNAQSQGVALVHAMPSPRVC